MTEEMQEMHDRAQLEQRIKTINSATRIYWKSTRWNDSTIVRFGIELCSNQDIGTMDSAEYSDFLDKLVNHVLELNLSDLAIASDYLYNTLAMNYSDRDITVEFTGNLNQPLLTTYYFNNQAVKEH
jgi:hypothetical protein